VTIVTVNRNNAAGLVRTFDSVRRLTFSNFQYVVIDGASTDDSMDVVENQRDLIDRCVHELDTGTYNAMNKARSIAQGRYILFLNSGDYFASPEALSDIDLDTGEDLVYGNHTYRNPATGEVDITQYDGSLDLGFFWRTTIAQCSTLIKRTCLDNLDWFDTRYPIAADWVFFCRAVLERGCSARHIDRSISVFELGGTSTAPENSMVVHAERERFLRSFLPAHVYDYVAAAEAMRVRNQRLAGDIGVLQRQLIQSREMSMRFRARRFLGRVKRKFFDFGV